MSIAVPILIAAIAGLLFSIRHKDDFAILISACQVAAFALTISGEGVVIWSGLIVFWASIIMVMVYGFLSKDLNPGERTVLFLLALLMFVGLTFRMLSLDYANELPLVTLCGVIVYLPVTSKGFYKKAAFGFVSFLVVVAVIDAWPLIQEWA